MRKIRVVPFGIGTLIKSSPLLSFDSKYLFTIGDDCVYVWIVESGECLRKLVDQSNEARSKVVSISLNPHNRLQLCLAFQHGSIDVWDYEDGFKIQTLSFPSNIHSIYSIFNLGLYVLAVNAKNVYSLSFYKTVRQESEPAVVFEKLSGQPKSISFNEKGSWSCFVNQEGNHIYILNLSSKQMKCLTLNKKDFPSTDRINLVEMHPHDHCLALACQSGRILLWFDCFDQVNEKRHISHLHWHSLPVLALKFSSDGSYLFSGGHESVLVKWIYKSQEPTFRPRLGSPIISIVPSIDQTFYVTMHSDNNLQIIGSNLSIRQTIAGLNTISVNDEKTPFPTGLNLFNRQRAIVVNSGKPGFLQFISIDSGKQIYQLDVVGENYVSPSELNSEYQSTDIKRIAFDRQDDWLATFEERTSKRMPVDDDQNERKLRLWKIVDNDSTLNFELNTTITYPHGQTTLNNIHFHPEKSQLATSGDDGFVKIWVFVDLNPITKRNCHWRCLSAFSHRSYRSWSICFYKLSTDGVEDWFVCSSFGHLVKIWIDDSRREDQETSYSYSKCLSHFDRKDAVRSIHQDCQTTIVVHQNVVNLWKSRTGEYLRCFHWSCQSVAQDFLSSRLALFEKNFVHFYSFVDGKCQSRKHVSFRQVRSAVFVGSTKKSSSSSDLFEKSRLIVSIDDQGLKMLEDENELEQDSSTTNKIEIDCSSTEEKRRILLSLINSNENDRGVKRKRSSIDDSKSNGRSKDSFLVQCLSTPSYLLPSIDRYSVLSLKEVNDIRR